MSFAFRLFFACLGDCFLLSFRCVVCYLFTCLIDFRLRIDISLAFRLLCVRSSFMCVF